MVRLVVKGTKFPDEFSFVTSCSTRWSDLAGILTTIQNDRHKVRQQLFSARELLEEVEKTEKTAATARLVAGYAALVSEISNVLKSPQTSIGATQFATYWKQVKEMTMDVFPKECRRSDGEEATVTWLFQQYENPDIDENYRVHIFHCRAIMDPQNRQHELTDIATAAVWCCGKQMSPSDTVGKCCGNNKKSSVTVKIAAPDSAPAKEPRISYDEQRQLRVFAEEKKSQLASLEDSELRDRVAKMSRGTCVLPASGSTGNSSIAARGLNTTGLRPIYSGAQEKMLNGE